MKKIMGINYGLNGGWGALIAVLGLLYPNEWRYGYIDNRVFLQNQ